MKTFIMTLFLFLGITGFANAQTDTGTRRERSSKKEDTKARRQMHHFDKRKPDKNIKYNGTEAYHKTHPEVYVVDGNGFPAPKSHYSGGDQRAKKGLLYRRRNSNAYARR